MTITTPDGRTVRLVPQDGPPTEPGLYLAEYTPAVQLLGRDSPPAVRHTIAREVTRDERGRMCHGPDSARLEWWARIVHEAPVSEGIRALAVDGAVGGASVRVGIDDDGHVVIAWLSGIANPGPPTWVSTTFRDRLGFSGTETTPDGRLVRLVPQDGPPTEPGLYLAEYTPPAAWLGSATWPPPARYTIARRVRIDGTGCLDHGSDSARLEWWARIVFEASGGGTAGIATVDGEANGQRGGAGEAEPSTPGREVVHLARGPGAGVECNTLARLTPAVAFDERAAVTCTACLHTLLALTEDARTRWRERAAVAESRVAELEAAQRWVPLTEQLPPQDGNTDVEVASFRLPECPRGAIALLDESGQWIPEDGPLDFTPTHWRALGPSYDAIRAQADEYGVWRPAGPEVQP